MSRPLLFVVGMVGLTVGLLAVLPARASAVTFVFQTPISGDVVPVTLEILDAPSGEGVDFAISIPAGEGDLLGLFGNLTDETLTAALAVHDPTGIVTQWQFSANNVWKVGGGNVMSPVKKWDWGLRLAANGSAGGAVESASFGLRAPGLSVATVLNALNQGWVLGVRIQSTTGPEGSSKIGLADGTPPVGPDPPTITIDQPLDGTITNQTVLTVAGAITGEGVTTTVNGVAATGSGGSYAAQVPLVEGSNTIVATAINAGGSATAQIQVVLDTSPPVVEITLPQDQAFLSTSPVLVQGTVVDSSPISSFRIEDVDVALVDGAFSTTVPLPLDQAFAIDAVAIDAAGNAGSDLVTVTFGLPPTITIDVPTTGTQTVDASIIVSGSVTGSAISEVRVNGVPTPVAAGTYSATLPLALGNNPVMAEVVTVFGQASASVTVVRGEAPTIAISQPAGGALVATTPVVVTGSVTGDPAPSVIVGGIPATVAAGTFSASVPLVEGANSLTATATNAFGTATAATSVLLDTIPPVVLIGTPMAGEQIDGATTPVSGGVVDASPIVAITLNGQPIAPGTNFSGTLDLVEGPNAITVAATDAAGLSGSATVNVIGIATAPLTLEIETPPQGALFSQNAIEVAGLVGDPGAIVEVNGVTATTTGARWVAAAVPLTSEGTNAIVATARLGAETATDQVDVVYNAPPVVEIFQPPIGEVVSGPQIDVEGVVDDITALVSVNGVVATVDSGGRFVAAGVPIQVGPNRLVARAVDPLGAAGRDEVDIVRDDAVLGQIRIVLLDPIRDPFVVGNLFPGRVPIAVEDLESFLEEIRARQLLTPALFSPPVGEVTQGTFFRDLDPIYLYVFVSRGEIGMDVVLDELNPNFVIDTRFAPLQPLDELEADLQLLNVDGSVAERLVPRDFAPNGFARFEVTILGLDGGGGGGD